MKATDLVRMVMRMSLKVSVYRWGWVQPTITKMLPPCLMGSGVRGDDILEGNEEAFLSQTETIPVGPEVQRWIYDGREWIWRTKKIPNWTGIRKRKVGNA